MKRLDMSDPGLVQIPLCFASIFGLKQEKSEMGS